MQLVSPVAMPAERRRTLRLPAHAESLESALRLDDCWLQLGVGALPGAGDVGIGIDGLRALADPLVDASSLEHPDDAARDRLEELLVEDRCRFAILPAG